MISFKQLIKSGEIKRADAMKVRIEDVHEEIGFNLRREGEELESSINSLAEFIRSGGILPPLEVRPREDGGVFVVDGHRRRRAYIKAGDSIRDAFGELWVHVVAFAGNDAERVARIITSAEGRALSALEIGEGYKRLVHFGWTADQIATKVGKTRQSVDYALVLANADSDVQKLVSDGSVAATTAIDAVRKHGGKAGAVLGEAVTTARRDGKKKATSGAINGKALPKKLVEEFYVSAQSLFAASKDARVRLNGPSLLSAGELVEVSATALYELMDIVAEIERTKEQQRLRGSAKPAKAAQADALEGQA